MGFLGIFLFIWTMGWLGHETIVVCSWWSGRLYWKPKNFCYCESCKSERTTQYPTLKKTAHEVPHRLELDEVIGLAFGGLFLWWAFIIMEVHDGLISAREKHLEDLKKKNRPIEEVLNELNEMLVKEGCSEEMTDLVTKVREQNKEDKGK